MHHCTGSPRLVLLPLLHCPRPVKPFFHDHSGSCFIASFRWTYHMHHVLCWAYLPDWRRNTLCNLCKTNWMYTYTYSRQNSPGSHFTAKCIVLLKHSIPFLVRQRFSPITHEFAAVRYWFAHRVVCHFVVARFTVEVLAFYIRYRVFRFSWYWFCCYTVKMNYCWILKRRVASFMTPFRFR